MIALKHISLQFTKLHFISIQITVTDEGKNKIMTANIYLGNHFHRIRMEENGMHLQSGRGQRDRHSKLKA